MIEFSQIALLLVVAAVFGTVAKVLRQPLLVGYLLAGFLLYSLGFLDNHDQLELLGQIGVALLLFLLGIEMNLKELPSIGKIALFTGLGQIIITGGVGFVLASLLGFETLPSIYIAIALAFSSTIIIVKLLSEKKDLRSLYGKISIGFLLVQDFVAMIILMFLSGIGGDSLGGQDYIFIGVKVLLLFAGVWFMSRKFMGKVFDKLVATSTELLFIVSIAWALGIASFVAGPMGFTLEVGGFLAGLALSNLPEHLQIVSRTKPLRDFFLTIFFLLLGAQLGVGESLIYILPLSLVLAAFVLVGNPIIVMSIMGFLGYRKRTSFMSGLTVAQISEFSFILMAMGLSLGHVSGQDVAIVIMVGVITMVASTYLILGADGVYAKIGGMLSLFERRRTKEDAFINVGDIALSRHIVLVGCDRTGKRLVTYFVKNAISFLIVDFNPEVFRRLTAENVNVIFGDIHDPEIIEASNIAGARMVISTVSNLSDNLALLENIRAMDEKPVTIITSASRNEAVKLYEAGASYVIVPEIVAGEFIIQLFSSYGTSPARYEKLGKHHFNRLIYK
jgi:Kef-type K+ transport system membrane component KefB/voltage-gated potassium channel Kch